MNDVSISKKNILPTFLLFIVLSWPFGAHRFFITIGGLGIWWIVDFILIVTGEMKDDHGNKVSRWVD